MCGGAVPSTLVEGSRVRRIASTTDRTLSSLTWGSGWPGESLEFFSFSFFARGSPPRAGFFAPGSVCRLVLVHCQPERGHHVWRGGSFNNDRRNARSSYRNNNQPDEQNQNLGFRLAGGRGTGLTACCQSPVEESAGACYSTSGPRSRRRAASCVK